MRMSIAIMSAAAVIAAATAVTVPASAAASADLQLTATSDPGRSVLDLTVRVKNAGPSIAHNVVVLADFAGAFKSADETTSSHKNTTCGPAGVAAGYTTAVACKVPQLVGGATWTLTYAIHAPTGTGLREVVATNSSVADPTTANNSAKLSNLAGPVQDLDLFGTISRSPAANADTVVFKVENFGPNTVNNRVTVNIATTGLIFTSASANGQCTGGGSFDGTCVFDALPVDGVWSATFTCTGPANLKIAPVPGAVDPNTSNNVLVLHT